MITHRPNPAALGRASFPVSRKHLEELFPGIKLSPGTAVDVELTIKELFVDEVEIPNE